MRPTPLASAVCALGLLAVGTLAEVRADGGLAGAALVAVLVGLAVFSRAVFRLAEGGAHPPPRRRRVR